MKKTEAVWSSLRRRSSVSVLAILVGSGMMSGVMLPQVASAQEAATPFAVAAGDLTTVLRQLGEQAGVQFIYPATLTAGLRSAGVAGRMTREQAVAAALGGTGLTYRFTDAKTVIVSAPIGAADVGDGSRVLGPVRVEGQQGGGVAGLAGATAANGINGSTDVTATEGTKSYTSNALTVGSKAPVSIKDLPQTVSVLTSQRIEDQRITSLSQALSVLPGVTVLGGGGDTDSTFVSRGYEITAFQIDGGVPLSGTTGDASTNFRPRIDMAQYDHVELLRGAEGALNGYGTPAGTINLVRKKPLDHGQVVVEGQVSSWQNYRGVLDVTGPLAFDGRLRARAVVSYQQNNLFYDTAKNEEQTIYGIAQFDATPTTLLSAGLSLRRQRSVPWVGGLPRLSNGVDPQLPRSTSFMFPWNRATFDTDQYFAKVEQKLIGDWAFKAEATLNKQRAFDRVGYRAGTVDPITGAGSTFEVNDSSSPNTQKTAEATVAGSVDLLGHRHSFVLGANYNNNDDAGAITYGNPLVDDSPALDIYNFNPNDPLYRDPGGALPTNDTRVSERTQWGIYGTARLNPVDRVHLTVQMRYSHFDSKSEIDQLCSDNFFPCNRLPLGAVSSTSVRRYSGSNFTWPPSGSLSYDVTKNLSTYISYTDIYRNQSNQLQRDMSSSGPITGGNYETGVKWQSPNDKINVSVAAYRIERTGFVANDPAAYARRANGTLNLNVATNEAGQQFPRSVVSPGVSCCWIGGFDAKEVSQGVDVEVSGEVLPHVQVSAGYTYNTNKFTGDPDDVRTLSRPANGTPVYSLQPKHIAKFWATYRPELANFLEGISLSVGANAQSSSYRAGIICDPAVVVDPDDFCPQVSYDFTTPGYVLVSYAVGYDITPNTSVGLNVNNLFDKRYYRTLLGVGDSTLNGNWYGEPRNFTLSLRSKW